MILDEKRDLSHLVFASQGYGHTCVPMCTLVLWF